MIPAFKKRAVEIANKLKPFVWRIITKKIITTTIKVKNITKSSFALDLVFCLLPQREHFLASLEISAKHSLHFLFLLAFLYVNDNLLLYRIKCFTTKNHFL